jgi:hypothetical protein
MSRPIQLPIDAIATMRGFVGRAQAWLNTHILTAHVRPLFTGVGTGAAMGAGFAIAGQIFQRAKFNNADITLAKGAIFGHVTWSPQDEARLDALKARLNSPQPHSRRRRSAQKSHALYNATGCGHRQRWALTPALPMAGRSRLLGRADVLSELIAAGWSETSLPEDPLPNGATEPVFAEAQASASP